MSWWPWRKKQPRRLVEYVGPDVVLNAFVMRVDSTSTLAGEQHTVRLRIGDLDAVRLQVPRTALPLFEAGEEVALIVRRRDDGIASRP
jgi:hypothetical protein